MSDKQEVLATEAAISEEIMLKLTLELVRAVLDAEELVGAFTQDLLANFNEAIQRISHVRVC